MNKEVHIQASDGSGSFSAYMSLPNTDKPAPAVIVIQEIFGVNAGLRTMCDRLAEQGYIAICPDLFWRQEPGIQLTDKSEAEWKRAFELFNGFNVDKGIDDLKTTLAHIRKDQNCSGKVGTVGYCLGGKLAYLMAARSDAECNVSYYGVDIPSFLSEAANIKKPLMMHIAKLDKFVPPEAQAKMIEGLKGKAMIYTYDADHAFSRVNGQHYDKTSAELANSRTAEFLASNLKG